MLATLLSAKWRWALALGLVCPQLAAAPPQVTGIRAAQRPGTHLVDIFYNLADPDNDLCTVTLLISADGGVSYSVPVLNTSGAIGPNVAPGQERQIIWNAGADWPGQFTDQARVRLIADDGTASQELSRLALIPAGLFQMGDHLDNNLNAQPVHDVYVSAFFMDRFEVNGELWSQVATWAASRGYPGLSAAWAAERHPVQNVSWYQAVRWCNARSEMENLTPVYYTTADQTTVYREGQIDLANQMVRWEANGYRLPTEAEWEKASRGGLKGQRYPWGNAIESSQANYYESGDPFESWASPRTSPVGYYNGNQVPPGANMANGYGLYDMAGNVWEWCWDIGTLDYFDRITFEGPIYNPKGGSFIGYGRVRRGGSSTDYSGNTHSCSSRHLLPPSHQGSSIGFRCARGL